MDGALGNPAANLVLQASRPNDRGWCSRRPPAIRRASQGTSDKQRSSNLLTPLALRGPHPSPEGHPTTRTTAARTTRPRAFDTRMSAERGRDGAKGFTAPRGSHGTESGASRYPKGSRHENRPGAIMPARGAGDEVSRPRRGRGRARERGWA